MNQTARMLAEFMDGMNKMGGVDPATIIAQAERAVSRAKLPESLVREATAFLEAQDRC